uniref:BZIP domain-containing protein n=1 Tax=Heliothis virescens TaxID=7102 RepID=A0A2A4JQR4_HELVI
MDDNGKHTSSYQLDQEILDARGIGMSVAEVAGLSTCKYSERVQALRLSDDDLAFLKGLRRRIKNRLASQNSRRRSVEHLRRLARELRAVRACRDDALAERRTLVTQRDSLRDSCIRLRRYVVQRLQERSDTTEVPILDLEINKESQLTVPVKKVTVTETKTPLLSECFDKTIDADSNIFECRIDKLVQQSVNHIFKNETVEKKKVFAKTVFISNEKLSSNIKSMVLSEGDGLKILEGDDGVLNLSLKEGRRKSHGRKQLAPRRIAYVYTDNNDGVLDLKIKKENQ